MFGRATYLFYKYCADSLRNSYQGGELAVNPLLGSKCFANRQPPHRCSRELKSNHRRKRAGSSPSYFGYSSQQGGCCIRDPVVCCTLRLLPCQRYEVAYQKFHRLAFVCRQFCLSFCSVSNFSIFSVCLCVVTNSCRHVTDGREEREGKHTY